MNKILLLLGLSFFSLINLDGKNREEIIDLLVQEKKKLNLQQEIIPKDQKERDTALRKAYILALSIDTNEGLQGVVRLLSLMYDDYMDAHILNVWFMQDNPDIRKAVLILYIYKYGNQTSHPYSFYPLMERMNPTEKNKRLNEYDEVISDDEAQTESKDLNFVFKGTLYEGRRTK